MKKRSKKEKRETLPKLLLKSFSVAAALCIAFAAGFWNYLEDRVRHMCTNDLNTVVSSVQGHAASIDENRDSRFKMAEFSSYLTKYVYYDIILDDPLSSGKYLHIAPRYTPDCHAVAVVTDMDDNIVTANRWTMQTYLFFGKEDPDNGNYVCDEKVFNIPGVRQAYSDYRELSKEESSNIYLNMELESAYVNREGHTFIPHKGKIELKEWKKDTSAVEEISETVLRTKEIDITIDDDSFELLELSRFSKKEPPSYTLFGFWGEEQEFLDLFEKDHYHTSFPDYPEGGFRIPESDTDLYMVNQSQIYMDHEQYFVYILFLVNYKTPEFMHFYWKYVILFSLGVLLLTALYCWRRNVSNKAKYAMEDYRRDLTNHLAHDIKTPLMAIGGYTENIMEGKLTAQEQQQYLGAILDNIAFTDSIINRTLFLNSIGSSSDTKPEKIAVKKTVEEAVKKYEPLLKEKIVSFTLEGSSVIKADRTSFEKIIENLVSNAVKYTPEGGSIKVKADRKRLIITNTVDKKLDVSELMKPFVRGEEARSNLGGSGLGLSIAERAAVLNGFRLDISCTDSEFTAGLKY